jgi:inositol phosphorylceramide mannosyltransferase catalytic subunit
MQERIPPRIIQTARTRNLSMLARAAQVTLTQLNPGFEFLLFDDIAVESFINETFPQYRDVFDGFPYHIQKFDFFRYLVVWELGGFYFDLDVFLVSGLHPLLERSCVFPFEELTLNRYLRREYNMDWELGNYAFGAARRHPFVGEVIQNCIRAQRDPDWVKPMSRGLPTVLQRENYVLNTTGPGLVSRTLAESPALATSVTVLFPDDVCQSESWHRFGEFGVHLMDGSWRGKEHFIYRRLAWMWEAWLQRRLQGESAKLGDKRDVRMIKPSGAVA